MRKWLQPIGMGVFLWTAASGPASAATNTWTGLGGNNLWTTAANWSNNVAPVAGSDLVFPAGAARLASQNDFPTGTSFNSITFGGGGYSFSGASVLLASGIQASHTSGLNTLLVPVQLSASQTFTNSNAGALIFNGGINLNGSEATFGVDAGEIQVNLGSITGAGNVIKAGAGLLTVGTSNAYTGTTEVRQGTFVLTHPWSLGATNGGTTVFTNATLRIDGNIPGLTNSEPLVLAGRLQSSGSGTNANIWSGPVTLTGATASLDVIQKPMTIQGVISGAGDLTIVGSSTLILNGTNTYTGTTTNLGARLLVNGAQPQSPIVLTSGQLGGNGVVGTITASGASVTAVTPGASPGILTCSNVTFNSGTSFAIELNGTNAAGGYDRLNVNGSVTLGNAALSIALGYNPAPGDSFLVISNDGNDPVTGTFAGLPEGGVIALGTNQLQVTYAGGTGNDVVLTVPLTPIRSTRTWDGGGSNARWTNPTNWSDNLAPLPGDDLVFPSVASQLTASNDFASDTVFNSILVGRGDYIFEGSRITLNAGLTATNRLGLNTWRIPLLLASNQVFTATATNLATQFFLQASIATGGRELTLNGTGLWQVSGAITGAGSLTKSGSGSALLYASNSFSGPVQVLQGRLDIYTNSALGLTNAGTSVAAGAVLVVATPAPVNEPLALAGQLRFAGTGSRTISGPVTISGALAAIQTDVSTVLLGDLNGSGNFTKSGASILTLAAGGSYSGTTTISNGTLLVNGTLPASEIILQGGRLGGSGSVGRITGLTAGEVSPGASPGLLSSSNITLNSPTTFTVELSGTTPGTGYDQLNVSGTVSLANCVLNPTLGFTPALNDTFKIIDNDGADAVGGTFQNLPQNALLTNGPSILRVSYTGGDGNDVTLTAIAYAPPPAIAIAPAAPGFAQISWSPAPGTNWILQEALNLTSGWTNSPSGITNPITVPASAPSKFYRLFRP